MTNPPSSSTTISVRVGQGSVFSIEAHHWPEGAASRDAPEIFGDFWPPRGCVVGDDEAGVAERSFSVDVSSVESLLRFESDFGLYVAEKLDGFVAVHSALIVVGEAVVIVPGVSHRGKSTLALAVKKMGFRVLSDEYTLIDGETGLVAGWSRPLRQRHSDGTISRITLDVDNGNYQPTHVLDVSYQAGVAKTLDIEPIPAADVAFSLLGNTVCAQSRPEESLRATASVARAVKGYRGTRGEAEAAVTELVRLLKAGG